MSWIKRFLDGYREARDNDPVKRCKLYKDQGCSHVDGPECDFANCNMRLEYDLWNLEEKLDIPHRIRYYKTIILGDE